MDTTRDAADGAEDLQDVRAVRDDDTTVEPDPAADAAQVEWEHAEGEGATATRGTGPAEDEATEGFPTREQQPETQGASPVVADLGPDGEGDVNARGV